MDSKPNSGALFNNKARKTDKHPNLTGTAVINNVEYWVSGWQNISKSGMEYISLAFKPKVAKEEDVNQDEEMPF